ncbi:HAMP domain-containing protein [Erythrobacter donghaensis]|uniref:HAMP domain-containing protein n=1 Tax=Erythrobacter donghaensis TaxID=267135 RepID=UPI000A3B5FD6|nr:HAMP domain-containing protein [Erythrobacter donghaensis]
MLNWFTKDAPIRQKFMVLAAAGGMLGAVNLLAATLVWLGSAPPLTGVIAALVTITAVTGMLLLARTLICDPYVETVVRMEALAAGDLTSPFPHADHTDCVGPMSTAMTTFRSNAEMVRTASDHIEEVVELLTEALNRLAEGDLTHRISGMPRGENQRLAEAFNASVAKARDHDRRCAGDRERRAHLVGRNPRRLRRPCLAQRTAGRQP